MSVSTLTSDQHPRIVRCSSISPCGTSSIHPLPHLVTGRCHKKRIWRFVPLLLGNQLRALPRMARPHCWLSTIDDVTHLRLHLSLARPISAVLAWLSDSYVSRSLNFGSGFTSPSTLSDSDLKAIDLRTSSYTSRHCRYSCSVQDIIHLGGS